MHRLTRHYIHLLFVAAVCLGIDLPAHAVTFAFKHSPNAKRLQDKNIKELRGLLGEYKKMVADAGERFEIASRRHIQRYSIALQREVRSLTRDGKIDAAFAVQAKVDESKKWKIYPPNFEGVHFLDKIDLTVEGSDEAAKKAVDLSVEVEKLGQLYAKQGEKEWTGYRMYMLELVVRDGDKLLLRYDPDAYIFSEVYVINLSDPKRIQIAQWWSEEFRRRGDKPHSTGVFEKIDPPEDEKWEF